MAKLEKEMEIPIVEVFVEIAKLCESMNVPALHNFENCWECKLDEQWTVIVNGHREKKKWHDIEIAAFHCYVEFNGFPAGIFSPHHGSIAAGLEANEENLIKAIQKKRAEIVFNPKIEGGNGK